MKISKAVFDRLPDCILLDLDNTLYLYQPAHQAGMSSAREYASHELNLQGTDFDDCFQDARTEIKQRLGDTAASHSRILYFQRLIEKAGLASQSFATIQMEQAYWSAFLSQAELLPEVMDFLDDLRIEGIPVVIVTDLTAQIQHRKMVYLGLNKHIDWIVTSEEVGADKPHPLVFRLALAKLGGVEGPTWMIGDSAKCDIAGARRAVDSVTIQKLHTGVTEGLTGDELPDATFTEFSQLRRVLRQLSRGT